MRAAPELLGALTIGGGSARPWGGGGGGHRSHIRLQAARNVRKRRKNGWFPALFDLKPYVLLKST